jgi:uncharacterized protein
MKREFLIELNPWWDNENFRFEIKDRRGYTDNFQILDSNTLHSSVDIMIGPRRVGKTSLMRNVINMLLAKGISNKDILYFTSDNILATEFTLEEIIREFLDNLISDETKQKFILIDEIQDLKGWALTVKYFHDNFNIKFIVTGSSSLILSKDTSKLTGRFKLFEVLGLSFNEFLEFSNKKLYKTIEKNNELLEEYLYSGGYPEYVLTRDSIKLDNAIDATLYRDLLNVYGIRNPKILGQLLDYLADKVTTPVSPVRISKDLKITDETSKFYLQYLQDVYLIYPVYKYGYSNKITRSSLPKYYFSDTGILNSRSINKKIGLFAENAVYLNLRRQSSRKEFTDIYYHDNNQEIDFYLPKDRRYIEVKYRDELKEDDLIKYLGYENLSIFTKNKYKIQSRTSYPEIKFENIMDVLLK